jgi:ATP-dependent exoDNAse (exonuclease V) beta subunit
MNFTDLVLLERGFEGIVFSEQNHSYSIKKVEDKRICSVTQLIKKYEPPFESQKLASIVAKKQGVSVEDVMQLWDFKKHYACEKGTIFHSYVEDFLQKKKPSVDHRAVKKFVSKYDQYTDEETFCKDIAKYINNFLSFYKWWVKDHILVKTEYVVGDANSCVAGCVDNISYNVSENRLVVMDYKTNKEIKSKGYNGEKMLNELGHLNNCELVKYSLQLNIYTEIIEKNTSLTLAPPTIIWVGGSEGFEIIPCLNLKKEAQLILKLNENT